MPQTQKNANFVHDFRALLVISEVLLVDRLDGDELAGELVHAEVDFTEGAAAEHLACSVELSRRLRCLACRSERIL